MITRSEVPFSINGVKSSIHCLYQTAVKTLITVPRVYHYHDYIEFLYATSSDTGLWINGEKYTFSDGDLAIINSGEPHAFTFNDNSEYICLKFSPGIFSADSGCMFQLQYLLPMLSKDFNKKRILHAEELQGTNIAELFEETMKEWEEKRTASELVIRANIFKIFTHIIRIWEKNDLFNFTTKPSEAMQKALTYIADKNACVTEEEVAEFCSLSTNYFSRTFKNTIGKNFKDYICSTKLQNARTLLVTTDKNITEIAYETGFSSTSHFISSFKKEFKQTPKQFQKSIRNKA